MSEDRPYTVFLVEDSSLLAQFVVERLNSINIVVVASADNSVDAIIGIRGAKPDAVVLDLMLRDTSGFDVLREIHKWPENERPIVMVLTNFSLQPYREKAKEFGAAFFFDKAKEINAMIEMLGSLAVLRGAQRTAS
jgi:CheY-like chemotaxis protein